MTGCPEIEDLIQLALKSADDLTTDDAAIIGHIMECPACHESFLHAMNAKLADTAREQNNESIPHEHNRTHDSRSMDNLKSLVKKLQQQLAKQRILSMSPDVFSFLANPSSSRACAASPNRQMHSAAQKRPLTPTIRFAASAESRESLYWEAVLAFPMILQEQSTLTFTVKDARGARISHAVLFFRGCLLPVNNGTATISFQDFAQSMNGTGLHMIFANDETCPGDIQIA